ncbi:hypothetical protein [Pseudomonas corrugata]|uniref:hypothetical protein n=1 Tax=Pseudomonas corrugata TaxID=47879 RepID=UPI003B3AADDC
MGLFTAGELFFQDQAFVLLDLLLHRSRLGDLIQGFGLGLCEPGQLLSVTPVLEPPRKQRRTAGQQPEQHDNAHGT